MCPAYLRGEAYLMLHDGNAAAAEFQKFVDRRGLVGNFPWGALARLGLARAYALEAGVGAPLVGALVPAPIQSVPGREGHPQGAPLQQAGLVGHPQGVPLQQDALAKARTAY